MAHEIGIPTHGDERGKLSVIDGLLPFSIMRVYYIYGCGGKTRGGHRHRRTVQAFISVSGACTVEWNSPRSSGTVRLDSPDRCLLVEPEDWHIMTGFTEDAVLLVLASERHDPDDYIYERYAQ